MCNVHWNDLLCDVDQDLRFWRSYSAAPQFLRSHGCCKSLLASAWKHDPTTSQQRHYKQFTNRILSEAFERPPDRILRSKSAEIGILHRSSVHSFKSLTLANLLSQEAVYRSAAVHRRQPSYKKLRASFEVSCSWDQNTSDFIWISPIDCCADSFSHLIAYLRPKGRGRKLVGQGACIERICVATFWMPFFELKSFDVADTLTAAYHGILAHMHHNHSTTLPLTS